MKPSFDALGVAPELVRALAPITTPFPIQALTIPDALSGRDLCGKAKTGSGKTLAFGLPMLQRLSASASAGTEGQQSGRPRGLIMVPTRELARQVADVLRPLGEAIGLTLATIYGGTGMDSQIKSLRCPLDIVVATPGRLIDLQQRGDLHLDGVEILVLDEADRMADMGFLPPVEWVMRRLPAHQTMLFSATLDGDVDYLVRHYLSDPASHDVAEPVATISEMTHRFLAVHQMDKVKVAAAIAKTSPRTLLFTRTKRGADQLTRNLRAEGIQAAAIHGDLPQRLRERALAEFTSGKRPILVATDVAARGIHVEGIEVVIHFDPPEDYKTYLHRSGRTARAGEEGVVVTLVLWDQRLEVEKMQRRLGISQPVVEVFSNDPRLSDMRAFSPAASVA